MGLLEECRSLPDEDLTKALGFLAHHEKRAIARLLAHLSVFDERQLAMKTKGRSLFDYCAKELGFDEFDAYRRIRGARVALRFPVALDLVEQGKLSLTSLVVLHPILTPENHRDWFQKASGKSRRQLETLVAAQFPDQARPDQLRRLPPGAPYLVPAAPVHAVDVLDAARAGEAGVPLSEWGAMPASGPSSGRVWQDVFPISADRVRVGFDAAAALMRMIERAKQLLRHKHPEGRLEDVLMDVLELFLERKDPQRKLGLKGPAPARDASEEPEPGRLPTRFLRAYAAGRYIPAKVKASVWARDQGRCAWRFEDGTICGGRDFVEFDHIIPFAKGGRSEYRNLRLLCREHNQLAAAAAFPPPGPTGTAPGLPATA